MDTSNVIQSAQRALKQINDIEENVKHEGLDALEKILIKQDKKLSEYGYDQVILKELLKLAKFESNDLLDKTLKLLKDNYYPIKIHHDQLAEALLYRYALDGNVNNNKACLENISLLMDYMDDNVAKHSKQILKVADLNTFPSLNPIIREILVKMKNKLPKRKTSSQIDV